MADESAKTYLDEATGEQVSKSELKKRQKLREKEAAKAAKAAAAEPVVKAAKEEGAADPVDEEESFSPS
ncbi:hypothetical protein HDU99_006625, partial [Rhizoclosmatium hyalinum]